MDPVGLAVGVVGLAGLFSVCLEAVERFDSWKKFDAELAYLGVRVEAERLRLYKWGQCVGFQQHLASRAEEWLRFNKAVDDGCSRPYHIAFEDERTVEVVKKLLLLLEELCKEADGVAVAEDPATKGIRRINNKFFGVSAAEEPALKGIRRTNSNHFDPATAEDPGVKGIRRTNSTRFGVSAAEDPGAKGIRRVNSNHADTSAAEDPGLKGIRRINNKIFGVSATEDPGIKGVRRVNSNQFGAGTAEDTDVKGIRRTNSNHFGILSTSKRARVKWALKDKATCIAQVEQIEILVQKLHDLVPPNEDRYQAQPPEYVAQHVQIVEDKTFSDRKYFHGLVLEIQRELRVEIRRELLYWLLGSYVSNEVFQTANEKRLDDTCEWILQRPQFLNWISEDFTNQSAKYLWVNGPAGFGKTVLCSKVVDHLKSTIKSPLAHFFFSSDFESRMDPFVALRSWLAQLASDTQILDLLQERWEPGHGQVASRADLVNMLQIVMQNSPGCTFIIDGLDECASVNAGRISSEDNSISGFIAAVHRAASGTSTRLMVTSRDESDIRQSIWGLEGVSVEEYKITETDVRPDIDRYSREVINRKLSNKPEDVQEELSQKLAERCNGQFLWIKLQEPTLRGGKNKKHLEAAIEKTPSGLEHLYDRNWTTIMNMDPEDSRRAQSILRWAAFAVRPLTVAELTEALLMDSSDADLDLDDMPDCIDEEYINGEILGICASLVEVRKSDGKTEGALQTVHFAHFSVKQFFLLRLTERQNVALANESLRLSAESLAHKELAKACLQYINTATVWEDAEADTNPIFRSFRNYAATVWHQHVIASESTEITELSNQFLNRQNPNYELWQKWFDINDNDEDTFVAVDEQPLYYTARFNLAETAKHILANSLGDVNKKSLRAGRPLLEIASASGHLRVAQVLLDAGADVNAQASDHCNALICASIFGSLETTKLLLQHGADASLVDDDQETALDVSCYKGHLDVVKALLDAGTDVNRESRVDSPLHHAASAGHTEIVKLLLSRGADARSIARNGCLPLHFAVENGHLAIVNLLIDSQPTSIDTTDDVEDTALLTAACSSHVAVAEALLQKGAFIEATDKDKDTPLLVSVGTGQLEMAKVLLQNGANMEAVNEAGVTPLLRAADVDNFDMVALLVEKGAELEATDSHGCTPLIVAVHHSNIAAVKLLLEKGVQLEPTDQDGDTPLLNALYYSNVEVVETLLKQGANIDARNNKGCTPLINASNNGNAAAVKQLLEMGVSPRTVTNAKNTALHLSAGLGLLPITLPVLGSCLHVDSDFTPRNDGTDSAPFIEIMTALLRQGADVDAKSNFGMTPLHSAARSGCTETIKHLIDAGACIATIGEHGWMPLHHAVASGSEDAARLLIDSGGDVNHAVEKTGITPLMIACKTRNTLLVELLLDKGADATARDALGGTALLGAVISGDVRIAKQLLQAAPNLINDTEYLERCALSYAVLHGDGTAMIELLLASELLEYNKKDKFGQSALSFAVRLQKRTATKLLLASGKFDLLSEDQFGRTPLSWAKQLGCSSMDDYFSGERTAADSKKEKRKQEEEKMLTIAEEDEEKKEEKKEEKEGNGGADAPTEGDEPATSTSVEDLESLPSEVASDAGGDYDDGWRRWCDICLLKIELGLKYHLCELCSRGGTSFDVCLGCYAIGARCPNPGHEMSEKVSTIPWKDDE